MTISSTTNRAQFNCDGSTTSFPFTFRYLEASDLQVYLASPTGTVTLLTLNVDYQITPAIPGPGGTLSFLGGYLSSPPGSGYTLTILRFVPRTQEVDFRNGDALDEENIEGMGDKLTMMVQDLDERIGRAVTAPPSSSLSGIQLPTPEAGKFIRWNSVPDNLENATIADASVQVINEFWTDILAAAGSTLAEALAAMGLDPSLATLTLPDNVTVSDFAKTLLDDTDAATARATLGVPDASDASESAKGIAEIATQGETDAGTDDARIVTPAKLYATPGIYRRNVIINGDMRIAQRGTSVAASAGETYLVDRFSLNNQTDGAFTLSQYTASVPAGFRYSTYAAVSTADTSIGAAQYAGFCTKIEGYDFAPLVGKTCTLSFWVYSTRTGTYCVAFTNSGNDRAYIATYTINQASTWEYKTITVTFDFSGGTWNYTNGVGLKVWWMMACGSNYHATANAWQSGAYLATSSQVNVMQSTSDAFGVTGVQLEIGSAATQFEYRPYRHELALCQRYFVVFGASNDGQDIIGSGVSEGSSTAMALVNHPVEMRALPSLSYSSANHFAFRVASGSNNTATNITLSSISGTRDSWLSLTLATNPAAGYGGIVRSQTSGGRLYLSAEL